MFRIYDIIKENNSTFYDYRNNRRISRRVHNVCICACATIGCILSKDPSKDFLSAVVAVQAILIGFSFNVLFSLISQSKAPVIGTSLEDGLAKNKIEKLATEIFYNVSYFNVISLSCVIAALMLLTPLDSPEAIQKI